MGSTDYYLILIWCFIYALGGLLLLGGLRQLTQVQSRRRKQEKTARPITEIKTQGREELEGRRFRINHIVTLVLTLSFFSIIMMLLFLSLGLSNRADTLLKNPDLALTVISVFVIVCVSLAYLLRKGVYLELRKYVERNTRAE